MTLYFIQKKLADRQARAIETTRLNFEGTWLLKMKTIQTTWGPYQGLEISELVYLAVDPNLSVHGVAYKWWENSKKGEIFYPRDRRAKSTISGSITGQHVVLI